MISKHFLYCIASKKPELFSMLLNNRGPLPTRYLSHDFQKEQCSDSYFYSYMGDCQVSWQESQFQDISVYLCMDAVSLSFSVSPTLFPLSLFFPLLPLPLSSASYSAFLPSSSLLSLSISFSS